MTGVRVSSTLLELFRAFVVLVDECRRRLESDRGIAVERAQEPLLALLAEVEPNADGDPEDQYATDARSLDEARYLLACFADDQMTRPKSPRSAEWRAASLERRLFQSAGGGAEVVRRIEQLLQAGDPGRRSLAATYLLALCLGFQDQQKGRGEPHSDFKQRLLSMAAPDRQEATATWLTPGAYRHTVGQLRRLRLPNLRIWAWVAALAIAALLSVSYGVFRAETSPLVDPIDRIVGRDRGSS